jgi:thymidylate synthase (FAD)
MAEITLSSDISVQVVNITGNDQWIIGAMKVLPDVPPPDESDKGRIRYLMEHRHGTPFEHNSITLMVHAQIFVWREWHRHRIGFSYNETSARYTQLEPVFFVPDRNRPMIKVGDNWKPGRPKFLTLEEADQQDLLGGKHNFNFYDEMVSIRHTTSNSIRES